MTMPRFEEGQKVKDLRDGEVFEYNHKRDGYVVDHLPESFEKAGEN